jgi:threonine dehydratase
MPRFAPLVKVARCRQFGSTVVLHGDTFDEARSEAGRLAEERDLTYVHPFDDPQVIAGQGTLAFEILEQVPEAEAIVVPVGGGGLLAGVATVLQALKPSLQIIGVEPANAACFTAGLAANAPVRISTKFTLADGLAVAEAGRHTLAIVSGLAHRMVTVEEEALALAMLRMA